MKDGLVEIFVQRTKVTAAAIVRTPDLDSGEQKPAEYNHAVEQDINDLMQKLGVRTKSARILESDHFMDRQDDCRRGEVDGRGGGRAEMGTLKWGRTEKSIMPS